MQVPVEIQFHQVPGLLFPLRHKHREEHQHKENGAYQHHGGNEAEVMQGIGLHEQEAQESAYGGDIAHQQRIHLLRQGFPLVGLVFQVIHVVQRIVHGNADNGAADSQHDEAHAALEQGNQAQRK